MKKSPLLETIATIQEFNVNPETNEIYLHSHINGEVEVGIDYRSCTKFVKNFNFLDSSHNDRPIIVHLNTVGGVMSDGFAIFDTVKQSKKHVYMIGYSEVQSMSSIIFMAADTRLLMQNSTFMIHNAVLTVNDTPSHGLKSYAKLVAGNEQTMLNIYAEKCVNGPFFKQRGYSVAKVKSYIRGRITQNIDWYMGAEEALDLGFCDGIIGSKEFPSLDSIRTAK